MKIVEYLSVMITPIRRHLIFFLVTFLTLVPNTLKNFLAQWDVWEEHVVNFKYFSLAFLFAYILTAIINLFHSKILKCIFYFIDVVIFIQFIFLWISFHASFGPYHVMLIAETNPNESAEFLQEFVYTRNGLITVLSSLLYIAVIIVLEVIFKNTCNKFFLAFQRGIMCIVPFVLIIGIYNCRIYKGLFLCKTEQEMTAWAADQHTFPMDYVTTFLYSAYSPVALSNENNLAIKKTLEACNHKIMVDGVDSLNIIYILGESFIKYHSPLYGYSLNTTPFMKQEFENGRLFAFSDAIANQRYTLPAEKNTFSCNSLIQGEQFYDAPFFPALFKQSGYHVYLWDNHKFWAAGSQFAFAINSYLYCNDIIGLSYDDTNKNATTYDGDLVDDFRSRHNVLEGNLNLVMFHFFGQHFAASERFPDAPQYKRFTANNVGRKDLTKVQRQDIADYDNATLYTDDVVRKLACWYGDTPTVIIYFSDHGEEMYDFRVSKGRVECPEDPSNFLKYQTDVPFFVWCSASFIQRFPDKIEGLRRGQNKPFSTDNVCQILFDLGGVKSEWYFSERDVLSKDYKYSGRMVEGKYDYDKVRGLRYDENGCPVE